MRKRRKSEYDAEKLQWEKNERKRQDGLIDPGGRTEDWWDAEEKRIRDTSSSVAECQVGRAEVGARRKISKAREETKE